MKLTDKISTQLTSCIGNPTDIVIPNFYVGRYEMDLFRLTPALFVYEYEIKVSRSDFKNDSKKGYTNWKGVTTKKHELVQNGKRCNRFFYVVPFNMIRIDECPEYAGLIYYKDGRFDIVKHAKLLTKEKQKVDIYYKLTKKLAFRSVILRNKLMQVNLQKK